MVMEKELIYPLEQAFFGLTTSQASKVKLNIYDQIHEICFHGKGGYDWDTVYNFPIWLRKRIHTKIREFYDKQNEQYEKASKGGKNIQNAVNSDGTVNREVFQNSTPKHISYK